MPVPGTLRQPVMTRADAAQPATKMKVRFVFLFSILPTFDTLIRCAPTRAKTLQGYFGIQSVTNSKKPAKSSQTI
jgi:hypothetical protein